MMLMSTSPTLAASRTIGGPEGRHVRIFHPPRRSAAPPHPHDPRRRGSSPLHGPLESPLTPRSGLAQAQRRLDLAPGIPFKIRGDRADT